MDRDEILNQVRIVTQIAVGDVADADVVTIINQGVEEVGVVADWPWLEASVNISLVAATQTYALSSVASDFNRAVALVDDDNDDTIPFMAPAEFFRQVGNDTGNSSTTPDFWTIWEDKIYLSPIPSAADTNRLTLYYYKNPTQMATGAALPEWDTAFHWVLVEYAKWKLWERAEFFEEARLAFAQYASYVDQMAQFYDKRIKREPWIVGDGIIPITKDANITDLRI